MIAQVVSCQFQDIYIKNKIDVSLRSGKWRDLTWPRKGPKFNLHHLQEISLVFKWPC